MRFTEVNECTEVRDKQPIRDVTINIGEHFARVPARKAASSGSRLFREFRIDLLTQQRGCFEYRAVSYLFVIKLTSSRIEKRDNAAPPGGLETRAQRRR